MNIDGVTRKLVGIYIENFDSCLLFKQQSVMNTFVYRTLELNNALALFLPTSHLMKQKEKFPFGRCYGLHVWVLHSNRPVG